MECSGGRKRQGAPGRGRGVPVPSHQAQEPVDRSEQEREQRGGVIVRPRLEMSGRLVLFLVGLCRRMFRNREVRKLVQRAEDAVAEEQEPDQQERQEPVSGRVGQVIPLTRPPCSRLLQSPPRALRCPRGSRRRTPRPCPSRRPPSSSLLRGACSTRLQQRPCSGRSSCPAP